MKTCDCCGFILPNEYFPAKKGQSYATWMMSIPKKERNMMAKADFRVSVNDHIEDGIFCQFCLYETIYTMALKLKPKKTLGEIPNLKRKILK